MSCGVGCRLCSDPALLWLWLAAVAPIRSLAWEPPYALDATLGKTNKQKRPRKHLKKKNPLPFLDHH